MSQEIPSVEEMVEWDANDKKEYERKKREYNERKAEEKAEEDKQRLR